MSTTRGRSRSRSPVSSSRSSRSGSSSSSRSRSRSRSRSSSSESGEAYDFGPRYDPKEFDALTAEAQQRFIKRQRDANRRNLMKLERRRGQLIRDGHRDLGRQRKAMRREMEALRESLLHNIKHATNVTSASSSSRKRSRSRSRTPPPQRRPPAPQPQQRRQPSPPPPAHHAPKSRRAQQRERQRERERERLRQRSPPPTRRGPRARDSGTGEADFERQQAEYMRGVQQQPRPRASEREPSPAAMDPEDRHLGTISLVKTPRVRVEESGDRRIVMYGGASSSADAIAPQQQKPARDYDEDQPCYSYSSDHDEK